jgi:hypothetical protein
MLPPDEREVHHRHGHIDPFEALVTVAPRRRPHTVGGGQPVGVRFQNTNSSGSALLLQACPVLTRPVQRR